MDENEIAEETTDYVALAKENIVKGASLALGSVLVTIAWTALNNKLQSRRNGNTVEPITDNNE